MPATKHGTTDKIVDAIIARSDPPHTVREFSRLGPCVTLGEFVKRTRCKIFFVDTVGAYTCRQGRDVQQGLVHVEPCRSCRDHPATQYPDGYMD